MMPDKIVSIVDKEKADILDKWLYSWKNGDYLWAIQAGIIYQTIRDNTTDEALRILKADYQKFSNMGISSYIQEAIQDLERLKIMEKKEQGA